MVEEEIRKGKGNLVRRNSQNPVVLSHDPQSTTKETPFSLVYGSDSMILMEIQENSPRFQSFVVEDVEHRSFDDSNLC